jgi:hypothetical protein
MHNLLTGSSLIVPRERVFIRRTMFPKKKRLNRETKGESNGHGDDDNLMLRADIT